MPANRTMEHTVQRHSINNTAVGGKTNDATCKNVGGEVEVSCQSRGNVSSGRRRSTRRYRNQGIGRDFHT